MGNRRLGRATRASASMVRSSSPLKPILKRDDRADRGYQETSPKIGMSRAAERPSLRGSGLEFDRGRSVGELEPDDAADEADKE